MQIYCFWNPAHLFEWLVLRKEVANAHKDVEKGGVLFHFWWEWINITFIHISMVLSQKLKPLLEVLNPTQGWALKCQVTF